MGRRTRINAENDRLKAANQTEIVWKALLGQEPSNSGFDGLGPCLGQDHLTQQGFNNSGHNFESIFALSYRLCELILNGIRLLFSTAL